MSNQIEPKKVIILQVMSTIWYWAVLWYSNDMVITTENFLFSIISTIIIATLLSLGVVHLSKRIKKELFADILIMLVPTFWIIVVSILKLQIGLVSYSVLYNLGSGLIIGLPLSIAVYYSFVKGYIKI